MGKLSVIAPALKVSCAATTFVRGLPSHAVVPEGAFRPIKNCVATAAYYCSATLGAVSIFNKAPLATIDTSIKPELLAFRLIENKMMAVSDEKTMFSLKDAGTDDGVSRLGKVLGNVIASPATLALVFTKQPSQKGSERTGKSH